MVNRFRIKHLISLVVHAFAVLFIVLSSLANAARLGSLEPLSLFGEPLKASINVELDDIALEDYRVSLATVETHSLLDIEFSRYHQGLTAELKQNENGEHFIEIANSVKLREPVFEFIIQLRWPAGGIQRSYSLLPEFVSHQTASQTAAANDPIQNVVAPKTELTLPKAATTTSKQAAPTPIQAGEYIVRPGDSLWQIARKMDDGMGRLASRVDALMAANLDLIRTNVPQGIHPGDRLTIPSDIVIVPKRAEAAKPESNVQAPKPVIDKPQSGLPQLSSLDRQGLMARVKGKQLLRFMVIEGEQINSVMVAGNTPSSALAPQAAVIAPEESEVVKGLTAQVESLSQQNEAIVAQLTEVNQLLLDSQQTLPLQQPVQVQTSLFNWWYVVFFVLVLVVVVAALLFIRHRQKVENDDEDDLAYFYNDDAREDGEELSESKATVASEQIETDEEKYARPKVAESDIPSEEPLVAFDEIEEPIDVVEPIVSNVERLEFPARKESHEPTIEIETTDEPFVDPFGSEPIDRDVVSAQDESPTNIWEDAVEDNEVETADDTPQTVIEFQLETGDEEPVITPEPPVEESEPVAEIEFEPELTVAKSNVTSIDRDASKKLSDKPVFTDDADTPIKRMLLAGPQNKKPKVVHKGHTSNPLERALEIVDKNIKMALFYIEINDLDQIETKVGPLAAEQLAQDLGAKMADYMSFDTNSYMRLRDTTYIYVSQYNYQSELSDFGEAIAQMVMSAEFDMQGNAVDMSVSIGIVPLRGYFNSASEYLLCAKKTVEDARNMAEDGLQIPQVSVYTSLDKEGDTRQDQELVSHVFDLLEHDKFLVELQSFISLTGRSEHVYRAKVELAPYVSTTHLPENFLNAAFNSSASIALDKLVIRKALDEVMSNHSKMREIQVLVQISSRSLQDLEFIEWMKHFVASDDFYAKRITLMLNEQMVKDYRIPCWSFANAMKSSGYTLGLLGFGSTEASLELAVELGAKMVRFDDDRVDLAIKSSEGVTSLVELSMACRDRGIETITHTFNHVSIPDIWQFNIDAIRADYLQVPENSGEIDVAEA